jgi:pimeloyl-ACP methyl ester carboxylesterase
MKRLVSYRRKTETAYRYSISLTLLMYHVIKININQKIFICILDINKGQRSKALIDTTPSYTTGSLVSNSTTIGYRQIGSGPGIILLHGGMQYSRAYMRLATALADAFTVYVPDRRGRGMSGPPSDLYSITTECQDVAALQAKTGAELLFGHSSGGLIALQAALTLPAFRKVAVYEPPLSLHGSMPVAWVPQYERELAAGKLASALITVLKGIRTSPRLALVPRWLLLPLFSILLRSERKSAKPDEVPIRAFIPTQHYDMILVDEMNGKLDTFANMHPEVLLLGGGKSPAFLLQTLDALERTLPHVQRVDYPYLDHDGPNETAPERIATDLRTFFRQPDSRV